MSENVVKIDYNDKNAVLRGIKSGKLKPYNITANIKPLYLWKRNSESLNAVNIKNDIVL